MSEELEKFKKIEFSIRILHFHHYITDTQFLKMMNKFKKQVKSEMKIDE